MNEANLTKIRFFSCLSRAGIGRMRHGLLFCLGLSFFLLSGTLSTTSGATLPESFTETQVAGGLNQPTAMQFAPDGRLFVCLQGGQLRVIKDGALLPTLFLSVTTDSAGERGLLGIAFDPNFPVNNFLYVYYTTMTSPRRNRVSRFTANGDVAVPGSEVIVVELDDLSGATNHNGGAIHFGPDGKLYIAVGENANPSHAQTLNNRHGKILRLNSDGSIPPDNPFFDTAVGVNRSIWALGLRNPFTFAFQPKSDRMFVNDVGQSSWEEINDGMAGSNYGWPDTEGPTSDPRFTAPLFIYGHGIGPTTGCAIAGGAFYNPITIRFPLSYVGKYFFADLCSGWIRVLDPVDNTVTGFATGIASPVDLKVSADGSLYYLARGAGAVFKVESTATSPDPAIFIDKETDLAIALDSVTMLRDPFSVTRPSFLNVDDPRTRIMIFAINLGGDNPEVIVRAEVGQQMIENPIVEFFGEVPNLSWVTQIVIKAPDELTGGEDLLLSLEVNGVTSNKARVRIR